MPVSVITGGLPGALLEMVIAPVRKPDPVGVKVTLIMQLAAMATLEPHVFVWAKSPAAVMAVMLSTPLPLLVSVNVCAEEVLPSNWLLKTKLELEREMKGASAPVPLSVIVCGLPGALLVITRVPESVPVAEGVKVTIRAQEEEAARLEPHVFVCAKLPVVMTLIICNGAFPWLVSEMA